MIGHRIVRLKWALTAAFLACAAPLGTYAQDLGVVQSDILVVDADQLFADTDLGRQISDELEQERDALIARNRELEAELESEEQALTELRPETNPQEFRELADAFDTKVQTIRAESERRARDLERKSNQARLRFMQAVEPVLVDIMQDAGATVIMDGRGILLRAGAIDITDTAIVRINDRLGAKLPDTAADDAPDPDLDAPKSDGLDLDAAPTEPTTED